MPPRHTIRLLGAFTVARALLVAVLAVPPIPGASWAQTPPAPAQTSPFSGPLRLTSGRAADSEARAPVAPKVGRRFALAFDARLHRIGLDDNGTGAKTHLTIRLGVSSPHGPFGIGLRLSGDRCDLDRTSKTFRTDDAWHRWRFECDTTRRTVALFRDGAYVALHEAGSKQPAGLRFQVVGTPAAPADVSIRSVTIEPLPDSDALTTLAPLPTPAPEPPGQWRMWRRDERNTAASDLPGAIHTPRVAWSVPTGRMAPATTFLDLDGDGVKEALVSHGGALTAYRIDGTRLWRSDSPGATLFGIHDLAGDGRPGLVTVSGIPSRLQILEPATGRVLYDCPHFPRAGVAGVRIADLDPSRRGLEAVVWSAQHEVGFVLGFERGVADARIRWTFDWKTTNFTPTVALADMDRDGALDVVVTTYDRTFVFDGRRGRRKIDHVWPSGRNYGITVVRDVDGDGYPDVVVLADYLREHIAVLKNEGGRGLRMLWDRFVEQDYPDDRKSLRLLTESVDDFDGDGQMEIAGSVYDDAGDRVWHTLILDARTGAVKHDLPGLCLIAAGPLFPGQPPSLIVSRPTGRDALADDRLVVASLAGGRFREVARLPEGHLLTQGAFAPNAWSTHQVHTGAVRPFREGAAERGLFLELRSERAVAFVAGGADGRLTLLWKASAPAHLAPPAVSSRERPHATRLLKQHERAGRALDAVHLRAGEPPRLAAADADGALHLLAADGAPLGTIRPRVGFVTAPVVGRFRPGEAPRILFVDAGGTVRCLRAGGGRRPETLWTRPGSGSRPYLTPNLDTHGAPVLADVHGQGGLSALVTDGGNRLLALDGDGRATKEWRLPDRPVQWAVGRFDDDAVPDLFVTYPTGAFLDMESAALAGSDGRPLWTRHVGNGPPALVDLNGDGRDDVLLRDLFERRALDARAGRDILPVTLWAGYQTPTIVPLSGADRLPGVVWTGGMYALVAEGPIGTQRWWHPANSSLRDFAAGPQAVADVDGDGRPEVGGVTAGQLYNWPVFVRVDGPDREFLCYDARTGRERWRHPIGTTTSGVIAADVDGDGRHEFVFGTADGRLIALRGGPDPARRVVWEATFPAALGQPVAADVDGDGVLSILVSCADGNLYCVRG